MLVAFHRETAARQRRRLLTPAHVLYLDTRSRRNDKFVHAREPSLEPTKHL
eukprot:COSAG01_NODE_26143_length_722_cov_1.735152_2_plen_50_part_01